MISKILLLTSLIGFLVVGGLLFTNHPGFAIKITNYLFFAMLAFALYEYFKNYKKQK